jgi:hypothetical protein
LWNQVPPDAALDDIENIIAVVKGYLQVIGMAEYFLVMKTYSNQKNQIVLLA